MKITTTATKNNGGNSDGYNNNRSRLAKERWKVTGWRRGDRGERQNAEPLRLAGTHSHALARGHWTIYVCVCLCIGELMRMTKELYSCTAYGCSFLLFVSY